MKWVLSAYCSLQKWVSHDNSSSFVGGSYFNAGCRLTWPQHHLQVRCTMFLIVLFRSACKASHLLCTAGGKVAKFLRGCACCAVQGLVAPYQCFQTDGERIGKRIHWVSLLPSCSVSWKVRSDSSRLSPSCPCSVKYCPGFCWIVSFLHRSWYGVVFCI